MKRKYLSRLLIFFIIVCSIWGCSNDVNTEIPEGTNQENNQIPPEVLDIYTTGGVVFVGTVCNDEEGWYLEPEQPLNVTYHYFLDNPSEFEAMTRIELFASNIDYIEKLPYLGKTVTMEGTFSFYRDNFDKLYLLPYTIQIGKTVEESYGDSELQAPDYTQSRFDPAIPLPKLMDSEVRDGKYVYNAHMLSRESLDLMGNDFAEFYCDFVDAFLNYKTECPCPDREFAEMLSTIIYYEFPLYNICAESFEFMKHYDSEEQKVMITYKYDNQKHQQKIEEFMDSANTFLSTTSVEQSEEELAKNIYHELSSRMTYDYSALTEIERKDSHYAYMDQTGVCVTFANVYNQLLTQVGIETTTAHCDYTPTMGHVWSVITIDGEKYFCDPTFELNIDAGNGFQYFGQTYAQRLNDNMGTGGIYAGRYYPCIVDESYTASTSLD